MVFSERACLTYKTFYLGLLRPFAVSFCLSTTEAKHSRDILLPDILLSVLQFFSILFDFTIFTPLNLNIFSTSLFSETYYTFCFKNLRHVHFQLLIG